MENINNYPRILSLNPRELIEWCNHRKKEMNLSNSRLASISGVPEGTIDRIFTGKNPEFRYSTIQPIVACLIGIEDDTPTNASEEFYTNTIDGYKLIVENKNHVIEELKASYLQLQKEIEYLKKSNEEKQAIINSLSEHTKWMESLISSSRNNK